MRFCRSVRRPQSVQRTSNHTRIFLSRIVTLELNTSIPVDGSYLKVYNIQPTMAFNKLIVVIFIVYQFISVIMCDNSIISPDTAVFFKERIANNLTKVTWAHAVNSQENLTEALANDKIMMLEADIVIGEIINDPNNTIPIMAHPPAKTSDLSLEHFLQSVLKNGKRGVKLDFKTIEAFNSSLPILQQYRKQMTFPVWLNADILNGVNVDVKPVDAKQFLTGAVKTFPESVLSIGWTTKRGPLVANSTDKDYTQQQIKEMIATLSDNNITQTVSYPVRAGMAVNNLNLWSELLENTKKNKPTLTIWSADSDTVDTDKLSKLIKYIGVENVYVDVPEKLWKELNLSSSAVNNLPGSFVVVAIIAIYSFLNYF